MQKNLKDLKNKNLVNRNFLPFFVVTALAAILLIGWFLASEEAGAPESAKKEEPKSVEAELEELEMVPEIPESSFEELEADITQLEEETL